VNEHRLKAIPFHLIKTEHFMPAVEATLALAGKNVAVIRNNPAPPDFDNTLLALDFASEETGLCDRNLL